MVFPGGGTFQYNFTKSFSIKTCLFFDRKGSKLSINFTDQLGNPSGTAINKDKFSYFTIPILGKYTFGNNGNFFVNVGPSISYLIKSTVNIKSEVFFEDTYYTNTSSYKSIDLGLNTALA